MKALMQGIYTRVTELTGGVHNSFYNAIGGRFYFEIAPQDTAFPFCTYHIIHNAYDYMFVDNFEEFTIQFSIFSQSTSASEAMDVFEYLKTLFDWCERSLSVTGYSTVRVERLFSTTDYIDEENVFSQATQYKIQLKKT